MSTAVSNYLGWLDEFGTPFSREDVVFVGRGYLDGGRRAAVVMWNARVMISESEWQIEWGKRCLIIIIEPRPTVDAGQSRTKGTPSVRLHVSPPVAKQRPSFFLLEATYY